MQLFRQEAMRSQDRLHGDVDLAPPTSWQTITAGITVSFALAIGFLSVAHYSRATMVTATFESTAGTIAVAGGLTGTVRSVIVTEGEHVARGQTLATVDHVTTAATGGLEQRRARAAADEMRAIAARGPALREASRARVAALSDEALGARADLTSAIEQMSQQADLIAAARQDLDKAMAIAVNGFVSQQDVRRREEMLAERRQGMARLRQQAAVARATMAKTERDAERERASLKTAMIQVAADTAQADARSASDDAAPSTVVTAPVSGTVTGLAVVAGATLPAGGVAMSIVPDGGRLRLRLALPPQAAASVAAGQRARIAVDAFPYQTYGTVGAVINRVTPAAVPTRDGPRFVAYATPDATAITTYRRRRPFRAGMTATTRIRTMDRTLMQWLLDPLYAVMRR